MVCVLLPMRETSRRELLKLSGTGMTLGLAGCLDNESTGTAGNEQTSTGTGTTVGGTGKKFEGQELVVNGYGGDWAELFRKYIVKPFEEETGATITLDTCCLDGETTSKIMAQQGNPGFDVAFLTISYMKQVVDKGYALEIPKKYEHPYEMLDKYKELTMPHAPVTEVQFLSLFTHESKNKGTTNSWSALFNEENAGHVLMPKISNYLTAAYMLIVFAKIEGGGIDNIDPGFKRYADLCPDQLLTTYGASSEVFNYSSSGEVWTVPFWSGRGLIAVLQRDQPYQMSIPKEGAGMIVGGPLALSGTKKNELAFEFINHWSSPSSQVKWAKNYNVGPSHPEAVENLPEQYKNLVPNPNMNNFEKLFLPDADKLGTNQEAWTERWNREVGSKC
jgi:putative spermidine/putrescine transport system substrate-binding protein